MLATLDWWVIGAYLCLLLALGGVLSRRQQSGADYFVAGRSERPFSIALSVLSTQCSTNSILGAPAFVAFAAGGGLVWLQYELAVPLAMIFTMIFVIPMFQRLQLVSVYEYLERRFDLKTRLLLSGVFQALRLLAAAVTIYGVSAMIDLITGIGFLASVLIFGAERGGSPLPIASGRGHFSLVRVLSAPGCWVTSRSRLRRADFCWCWLCLACGDGSPQQRGKRARAQALTLALC